MQKHKTKINTPEQKREPKLFDPQSFNYLADSANEVYFEITQIGDEQCLVATLSDLREDAKLAFDASKSQDSTAWRSWQNELAHLAGDDGVEAIAEYTGQTGRLKTIMVAMFGVHNSSEVMAYLHELNDSLRQSGAERLEGVPDDLAYLPENLLMASLDIRRQVGASVQSIAQIGASALAVNSSGRRQ